jgi:hypothetical protein
MRFEPRSVLARDPLSSQFARTACRRAVTRRLGAKAGAVRQVDGGNGGRRLAAAARNGGCHASSSIRRRGFRSSSKEALVREWGGIRAWAAPVIDETRIDLGRGAVARRPRSIELPCPIEPVRRSEAAMVSEQFRHHDVAAAAFPASTPPTTCRQRLPGSDMRSSRACAGRWEWGPFPLSRQSAPTILNMIHLELVRSVHGAATGGGGGDHCRRRRPSGTSRETRGNRDRSAFRSATGCCGGPAVRRRGALDGGGRTEGGAHLHLLRSCTCGSGYFTSMRACYDLLGGREAYVALVHRSTGQDAPRPCR